MYMSQKEKKLCIMIVSVLAVALIIFLNIIAASEGPEVFWPSFWAGLTNTDNLGKSAVPVIATGLMIYFARKK